MPVESEADLAAFFNPAEFGTAAVYSPPGGGASTPCTLLMGTKDRTLQGTLGRTMMQGVEASARVSELPSPAKGGTLMVGSTVYKIQDDPRTDDAERRIWTFTLR